MTPQPGTAQPINCPACGTPNSASARFCNGCGGPLGDAFMPVVNQSTNGDPFIGTLIGHRFVVQEKIGEGGMGVVYRGLQTGIERPVALKLLHREYARDTTLLERFKNEAATASMLTHPNTVTIFDFGKTEDDSLYIAMEYLRGNELSGLIRKNGALEWARVCKIAEQICGSLEEAHQKKIIHRDLKPDNVMLIDNRRGRDIVKVLDFGIAKMKDRDSKQLTAAGEIFGTPEYMSPEQIKGDALTRASDIYALGVILYHMLTGTLPFSAKTPMALLVKHLSDDPPPFRIANSTVSIPTELESLVMLCLAKNPDERPHTMEEIGQFLKKKAKEAGETIRIESTLSAAIKDKSQKIRTESGEVRDDVASTMATPPKKRSQHAADVNNIPAKAPIPQAQKTGGPPPLAQPKPPRNGPSAAMPTNRSAAAVVQVAPAVAVDNESAPKPAEPAPSTPTQLLQQGATKEEILSALIKKMKRKRDFPAVSQHISELNTKAANNSISARQLSNVILKDYSLTGKLLKLINSPYYGQVRGKITTVSRAVVLMGFDQVRQSALGLLMFDHFCMQAGPQAEALTNAMLTSLLSGLTARHLASKVKGISSEEAFICSLMRNLGKNLVAFYFPAKHQQIMKKVRKENKSEELASLEILGVTFAELAQALAKEWNLPETILNSMQKLPDGPIGRPKNANEKLRNVSALSNELTYTATHGDLSRRKSDMHRLLDRFSDTIQIDEEEMETLYEDLTEKLGDYSEAMNLGFKNSPLIKRVMAWSGQQVSSIPDAMVSIAPEAVTTVRPLVSYTPEKMARQEQVAREKIMLHGIDEVASAVARHDDMNNVINMVMETMFRGLRLSHVVFCLYDVKKDLYRARSGYGDNADDIIRRFQFRASRSADLFTTAMAQGRDMFVDLEANKGYLSKLPGWYEEMFTPLPQQLIVYPILVNSFSLGMLYGDVSGGVPKLSRKQLTHMLKLRGHLAKTLKRAFPRIRRR